MRPIAMLLGARCRNSVRQAHTGLPLLVAATLMGGCGNGASPAAVPSGPPEAVVRVYLEALGRGDRATAAAALAPDNRGADRAPDHIDTATEADGIDHFRGMHNLQVQGPRPVGPYDGFPFTSEMAATWTSGSGPQTLFVIAGRRTTGAPWRVLSIGSGP
jgi:hypothetical protein